MRPDQELPPDLRFQLTGRDGVLRLNDMAFIPEDPGNRDWQQYQAWLEAGNMPDPAPLPPLRIELPDTSPTELNADPINPMDAVTRRYLDERLAELTQTFRRG